MTDPNRNLEARQESPTASEDVARTAGRGGIALTAAKLFFLISGLAQTIIMTWLLVDSYGALRGAMSPASITYNPLVSAGLQGMSRAVSHAQEGNQRAAIRQGLTVHWILAGLTALSFFLAAPTLGRLLNSDYLVPSFRILSVVVLFYGLYAPIVGILNGQRRFVLQASFDILSAVLRTGGLCVGAWLLLSDGTEKAVLGACYAFAGASVIMWALSLTSLKSAKGDGKASPLSSHLGFVVPVLGGQAVLNLLLQADTNTLRGFATRAAEAAGKEVQAADALVAAYNAGQLFAFLPYQLLVGVTLILFPLLSRAHATQNRDAIRVYTRTGVRVTLLLTGLVVGVSSGLSQNLLLLVFPPSYAPLGTASMQLLTLGLSTFALFGVLTVVLNSLGRQWLSLVITVIALGAVMGANLLLVRGVPFGEGLLVRTALSTSLGVGFGAVLAGIAVHRYAHGLMALASAVRIVLVTGLTIGIGRQIPTLGRPLTLVTAAGLAVLYLTLLWLLRELTDADRRQLKAILGR